MGIVHIFGVLCLLAATVLLVVVSVSLPVWNSVYFLEATINTGEQIRMGQWGVCVGNMCSKSKLGYDTAFIEQNASGTAKAAAVVVHGLTYALILHPIAAGLSFIALLFALGSHFALGLVASIFSFFAFLVTVVALGIDLGLFVTAHHRLSNLGSTNVMYHNALWFVVAAVAAQLIASFTVCFTHNESRRASRRDREMAGATAVPVNNGRGGWFARRRRANAVGDNTYAGNSTAPVMTQKHHWWQRRNNNVTGTYQDGTTY